MAHLGSLLWNWLARPLVKLLLLCLLLGGMMSIAVTFALEGYIEGEALEEPQEPPGE